jgi:glycosyltransferase involved in cell wall biosynthesis
LVNFLVPSYQLRESLKFFARALRNRSLLFPSLSFLMVRNPQKAIASTAVLAVLQSKSEEKWCEDDYGIHFSRSKIIPNGFEDAGDFQVSGARDIDVIMIGRIESRKDHLSVLQALSGSGLKVFLVGAENRHHRRYLEKVKALVSDNPTFTLLGPRPHDEVLSLAARSKVYISSSWLETGCLGDLESFAAGCRVIASAHSPTSEVLGDLVRYVRPGDVEEIQKTVFEELAKRTPVDMAKRKEVLEKYLWKNSSNQYIEIYRSEMTSHNPRPGDSVTA